MLLLNKNLLWSTFISLPLYCLLFNKTLTPQDSIHSVFFSGKAPFHPQPASPCPLLHSPAQVDHPGLPLSSLWKATLQIAYKSPFVHLSHAFNLFTVLLYHHFITFHINSIHSFFFFYFCVSCSVTNRILWFHRILLRCACCVSWWLKVVTVSVKVVTASYQGDRDWFPLKWKITLRKTKADASPQ